MAPARVVRQRKLAKTTFQQVLREDQIEPAEYSSLQNQYNVETGVEKSEEKARDPCPSFKSHDQASQCI
jgi:enhancer of polycomb-like protein